MTVKEKVLSLVELLPGEKLGEAERFLEGLLQEDPLLAALANAPEDDEPYTEEQQRADEDARARYRRGEGIPHGKLMRPAKDRAA